ncbi:hypothetical protein [Hymenobacter cheonanensis]|uniref:hypothetical protein n=1 Tax=Hymenobacter sp. CA2-7 TaxID=3063993 RepID=UPI002712822B|nr:hypothetical protein [Hymenobacter sp. CA2-7]MDO7885321.1 hypothetical protein [Hymenobacter sp. CA2-7]
MLLDIATREDIATLSAKFDLVLAALAKPAAPAIEELVTIEQVANHTKFDHRTVRDWVVNGRFDATGHKVYLKAYEYRNGQLRFKLSEAEAFGLKIGVLTPSLTAGAMPVKQGPAAKKHSKKRASLDSEEALKVA